MDKNCPSKNHPWSTLSTVTTFDKVSSVYSSRHLSSNTKKKSNNKAMKTCSPSIIISSLINYICELSEKDPKQKNNLRSLLYNVMQQMNLIDTSYKLKPLEFAENCYMDAIHQLITVAKSVIGSDNTFVPRPVWSYVSLYHDQFEEIGFIAGGGFGNVFKAKHKLDEVEYAIKKIIVKPGKVRTILNYLEEVKTLAKLNHSNIVSYKQAWIEPHNVSCLPQLPTSKNLKSNVIYESDISYDITNVSQSTSSKCKKSCRAILSEREFLNYNDKLSIKSSQKTFQSYSDNILFKDKESNQYSINFTSDTDNVIDVSSASEKISEISSDDVVFGEENNNACDSSKVSDSCSESDAGSENSTEESDDESLKNIKICQYSTENNLYTILYIQMELCEKTLRQWLDERTEPTAVSIMTDIATQMLCGLNYIHSKNIVHHDIKPSNIFISTSGKLEIQLGDFGLACPLQKESHNSAVGTCMYAAPEQLKGECNPKSDLYSLGIVFLELLVPMKTISECVRMIDALKSDRIPSDMASSHPKWIDIIIKLIQKNPAQRPSTDDLLEDLKIDKNLAITKLENENNKLKHENEKKDQLIKEKDQIINEQAIILKKLQKQIAKLTNQ